MKKIWKTILKSTFVFMVVLLASTSVAALEKQTISLTDTIAVDKTAERCVGDCRTFEVSLDITGTPQKAPVDVVLVIDRSGSMDFTATTNPTRTRLFYAKQAAVNFAGRVLGANGIPGSRVAVVSFSGPTTTSGNGNQNQASTDLDLSGNLTTVTNTINAISAVGGTNTEAGFKQGQAAIKGNASNQNPNSNKVVIMLTDGLPTASNGNRYAETTNINHNHIQNAINAGKYIFQNNIADVFTIGLTTGMNNTEKTLADNILTQAQNKGYYPAPQSTDLDAIFDTISQNLGYAATNAIVVDKIGGNFEFVAGSLSTTVGSASENSGTITWNPGTIVNAAQLKYKVVAKDSFVGGAAYTNEFAKLTYTDIFGVAGKTKDFPTPKVEVFAKLDATLTNATINMGDSITLGIGLDPLGENYMSPVTGGSGSYTYEWRIKGQEDIISGDKNPTVSPLVDTEYELTTTDEYGCSIVVTMVVEIINPNIDIPVKKVWVGPALESVTVQLIVDGVASEDTLVLDAEGEWTATFRGLPKYNADGSLIVYTVVENDLDDNYSSVVSKSELGFTITNTNEETINIPVEKVWIGPKAGPVTITLYADGVATTKTLVLTGGSDNWKGSFTGLDKYNNTDGELIVYTVKETAVTNYDTVITGSVAAGFVVTNTYVSPKIDVTGTKIWVNGPSVKPTIELQLFRDDEALGQPVKLVDGVTSYTWLDLDRTDAMGVDYVYTIDEVEVVENFEKTVEGLEVTNTYVSPLIDITMTKVWVGEIEEFPTIQIQLFRNGEAFGAPIELVDGATSATWTGLDMTDENGVDYVYTVDEVKVPEGYTKTIDGFTITNTFTDPIDPVDPVEPVDPVDPVEPTDPVESSPEPTLPVTGSASLAALYGIGFAAIFTGTLLIKKRKKK